MGDVIDLDSKRGPWLVGFCLCSKCGHEGVSVVPAWREMDLDHLECVKCGEMAGQLFPKSVKERVLPFPHRDQ